MAKLKAPLFSFAASGKLADSLVYFGWKGLAVVRSYVIPANPNSQAQQDQRGYLTAAVAKLHTVMSQAVHPLTTADKAAYAALASTFSTPRTWFNTICKNWIDCKVFGTTPVIFTSAAISSKVIDDFSCILYINEETGAKLTAGTFYFGTSKTAMINSATATVVASTSVALSAEDLSAWMVAGQKYYMQFKSDEDTDTEKADSGIFSFVAEPSAG
jgi:hypothetical protein